MERTIEEYKQIRLDLLEIQKIANELYNLGSMQVNPWDANASEKKKVFYQAYVDAYEKLWESGKIQSCECAHEVTESVLLWSKIRDEGYSIFRFPKRHRNSTQMKSAVYNLDTLIEKIEKIINQTATESEIRNVDKSLDGFGNCEVVVCKENELLNQAASLTFHSKTPADAIPSERVLISKPLSRF
ncbi:MAG: hypothetical protein R2824_16000 [Saprospiraceae bacterium]